MESSGRRLADRALPPEPGGSASSRAQRIPAVYDLSLPGNQAKLEAAEQLAQLAEEGLTMVHLALAFVLAHPAVTAPIIGPRTMEQLETSSAPPM